MTESRRRLLGWSMVAVQFALLAAVILAPRRTPWDQAWPPAVVVGVVLGLAGAVVLVLGFAGLGRALTATPVPLAGAGLRTGGIYSRIRHPIYSGLLLACAGYAVAVGSVITAILWVILFEFFRVKSDWEDRMLSERYGDEWADWAETTGGLAPRMRRRQP